MILHPAYSAPTSPEVEPQPRPWNWAHSFVLFQFVLQILLLFPQFGVLRVPMRVAAFGLSLVLLATLREKGLKHPATLTAAGVLGILVLSFCFHPQMNTINAGLAQAGLYLAILAPVFWTSRLRMTPIAFERLIALIWGFHTISAVFGVLQISYPGRFQPYLSTAIQNSAYKGENLMIILANGAKVYRPMGLTDTPGGAAAAGFYALLLGTAIALRYRHPLVRAAAITSGAIGLFCIYLSQVRSILVMAIVCLVGLAIVLIRQGKFTQVTAMVGGGTGLFLAVFSWATAVGGKATLQRLNSLVQDRADTVYQQNRGHFLQDTLTTLLPQYPLGAGLGRWGMMNNYFGNNSNPDTASIWVEIQWTGWLLDGGVPLVLAYCLALFLAFQASWKIALCRELGEFSFWGGLVFAYNLGALALTFNYPLFISQSGMEFWLLNGALFTAACHCWWQQTAAQG